MVHDIITTLHLREKNLIILYDLLILNIQFATFAELYSYYITLTKQMSKCKSSQAYTVVAVKVLESGFMLVKRHAWYSNTSVGGG